jgi:hypothetical protein
MRKDLERRIQRLERGSVQEFPARMRVFVAKHGGSLVMAEAARGGQDGRHPVPSTGE